MIYYHKVDMLVTLGPHEGQEMYQAILVGIHGMADKRVIGDAATTLEQAYRSLFDKVAKEVRIL